MVCRTGLHDEDQSGHLSFICLVLVMKAMRHNFCAFGLMVPSVLARAHCMGVPDSVFVVSLISKDFATKLIGQKSRKYHVCIRDTYLSEAKVCLLVYRLYSPMCHFHQLTVLHTQHSVRRIKNAIPLRGISKQPGLRTESIYYLGVRSC